MASFSIRTLSAQELPKHLDELADVLHAAVHAWASVGFVLPFSVEDSRAFWRAKVLPEVAGGGRVLWAAFTGDRIVGTVQLVLDLPQNQPHRCEVTKLLVHPDFRKRGIARALMEQLDQGARGHGKRLITLDTRTGDNADPLYRSLGFEVAGTIPHFARAPETPDRFDATTYMYKLI